ncbi:hypothetical protein FB451DRAFT_1397148 [Mycena latifolia]|nr:hypothetical protein FB451DRAFT_1397148 [Mycena latifolia]
MSYNLPPMRRVVTQTNPKTGDSHVLIDETVEAKKWDREGEGVRNFVVWGATGGSPCNVTTNGLDGSKLLIEPATVLENGSVMIVFDTGPGGSTAVHRSLSLDYFMVLAGQVDLELGEGKCVTLKAGDMGAQQATFHAWHNRSTTDWVRVAFVLVHCNPPPLEDGKEMPNLGPLVA